MAPACCWLPRRRRGRRRGRLDGGRLATASTVLLLLPLLLPSAAEARDWYSETLAVRRVGREGSRIYAQASFDFLWALEPGQLCPPTPKDNDQEEDVPIMPCAHGLFPPALSALVHAHGVQELSLALANGRWERDLWGDPTFPPSDPTSPQHHHHTEPPYGAEVWARLLLPSAADPEGHWRQLLEGLGALYHSSLALAAASTAGEGTDGIEAANVIGGGGGGRLLLDPPTAGAFRLSLPASVPGGKGYQLVTNTNTNTNTTSQQQQLRLAHLPAPAGLCTDTLLRTLLGHGPSLLSPCRGGGLGALLALGLEGEGGPLRLLTGDYLAYALELRRVCLDHEREQQSNTSSSSCHRPALAMRQTLRTVLPGASSLLAALQGSSSNAAPAPAWRLRPCTSNDGLPSPHHAFPSTPTLRSADGGGLLAGLDSSGFNTQPLQEEGRKDEDHPARWVAVGRSKGQPGADMTRGVLRLWLRNDHPSFGFRAEMLETLPFFLAPRVKALAATTTNPHHNQSIPLRPRFRRGQGKDPATLEYGLELPPASLVQVALPFRTRFLHFEDFPPNPSRGLDVPPAIIGLRRSSMDAAEGTARLTTEGLLIDVPLPDFSMPFNVITLVSTLLAFFFGSMLNVVVRKGRRQEMEEEGKGKGGLRYRLRGLVGRFRRREGNANEGKEE